MARRARQSEQARPAEPEKAPAAPAGPAAAPSPGWWEWDIPADRITWSADLHRFYGLPRDAELGFATFLEHLHPGDRSFVVQTIRSAREARLPFAFQHRIVRPDGAVRTLYCQGLVLPGPDGEAVRMVGTAQDITDDVGIEAPARRLDALAIHRQLVETLERATDAFVALDHEWRYTYLNRKAGEIFGRDPAALIGRRIWDEFPEGLGQPFHLAYEQAMREQVPLQLEAYYPPWERWFENRIYPSPTGLSIFFTDVSERHRREAEQRRTADLFQDITRHLDEVVYVAGPDPTDLRYVSPAFERIWGVPAEAMVADPWILPRSLHPEDRDLAMAHFTAGREQGWDLEYRIVRPDGEVRCVRDRGFPVHDAEGRFVRMVGVVHDVTARKAVEAERERLFRQLEGVVQQMPAGVLLAEAPSGRVVLANRHFEAFVGMPLGEQPLESVEAYAAYEGYRSDTGERLRPEEWPLARAVRRGETVTGEEIDVRRPDGGRATLRVSAAPIRGSGGHVVAAVATIDDVTAERQQDRLVHEQERVLEMLTLGEPLERILDAVVHFAEGGAEEELLGSVFLCEDHGESLRLVAAPNFPATLREALAEIPLREGYGACALAARERATIVSHDIAADPRWTALHGAAAAHGLRAAWAAPVRAGTGEVIGVFGLTTRRARRPTAHELQLCEGMARIAGLAIQRRRAEHEATQSIERFQLIARATSDIVYDWEVASGRLTWNEGVFGVFGYPPEEPVDSYDWWEAHLHPDDRARVTRSLQQAFDGGGQLWTDEYRFRRADGSWAAVYDRCIVLRDETGGVTRLLGSMLDVSERQDFEQQLRQAQKLEAIGQLAGGVAHDFNNLLTAIRCSAEFLLAGLAPGDPLRGDVEQIEQATDRATSLTRQLLAFSRKQVIQPQVLAANAVVAETEQMLRRVIGEDIQLVTTLDPQAGQVRIDRGQLQQILLNLAINARDAMPEGGALMIETGLAVLEPRPGRRHSDATAGPHVRITVTDTGTGMDPAVQARIFEPFFTTKPVGKGTGLGLSTVYGIVRQTGGRITVESDPGRGTTFSIYLPSHQGAGTPAAGARPERPERPTAPPPPARSAGTVLLVEDDRAVRVVVRRLLAARGFTVLEAKNGKEALRLAAEQPGTIDLVISDVVMPEMGGRELVDRLAVERPGLKVLLMSGYTQGTVARPEQLPAHVAFLEKPFVVDELVARLAELLERPL
ncbi:MAG TPA: PAS domain-containing protein [Gemmatimonadales bacterium]|nr:PAS domain-containing protein [Gemmatimonadales bacterium]